MSSRRSKTDLQAVQSEATCPLCGKDGITTAWSPLAFNYGTGGATVELKVEVPVHRCEACEFEYLDDEAEHQKQNAICRHLGVLTPTELRRIRKEYGMTRSQFAQLTRLGEASLYRWENGLSIQTHANDRYLRLLMLPSNRSHLENLLNSTPPLQSATQVGKKFRVIKMTDSLRKKQESFKLHKVA